MTTVFREDSYVFDPHRSMVFHSNIAFRGNIQFLESVAIGPNASSVSGNFSQAFGQFNDVRGDYNFVAGDHNQVVSNSCFVSGSHNVAGQDGCTVVGRFSQAVDEQAVFVVGGGADDDNRFNSLTAYANGYMVCQVIAVNNINVQSLVTDAVRVSTVDAGRANVDVLACSTLAPSDRGAASEVSSIAIPVDSSALSVDVRAQVCLNTRAIFDLTCQLSSDGGASYGGSGCSCQVQSSSNNTTSFMAQAPGTGRFLLASGLQGGDLQQVELRLSCSHGNCPIAVDVSGSAGGSLPLRNTGTLLAATAPTHVLLAVSGPAMATWTWSCTATI